MVAVSKVDSFSIKQKIFRTLSTNARSKLIQMGMSQVSIAQLSARKPVMDKKDLDIIFRVLSTTLD